MPLNTFIVFIHVVSCPLLPLCICLSLAPFGCVTKSCAKLAKLFAGSKILESWSKQSPELNTGHWNIVSRISLHDFPYSAVLPESNKLLMIYRKYLLLSKYPKYISSMTSNYSRYMATVTFYNVSHHCSEAPSFNRWIDFKIFIKTSHAGFRKKKRASPVEMGCVLFYSMFFHICGTKFTSSYILFNPMTIYIYISKRFQQNNLLTDFTPPKKKTSKFPHEMPSVPISTTKRRESPTHFLRLNRNGHCLRWCFCWCRGEFWWYVMFTNSRQKIFDFFRRFTT